MKRLSLRILFTIYVLIVGLGEIRMSDAASVLNQPPQSGTPQIPTPKPNPDVLNTPAPRLTDPSFDIGYIIPKRSGFEPCPQFVQEYLKSVYIGNPPSTLDHPWFYESCAFGNVTLTQTNARASMTGKLLRLWVRRVWGPTETIDIYEKPFGKENTLTFQVAFASASPSNNMDSVLTTLFSKGTPVNFYVQNSTPPSLRNLFTDTFYASLACRFVLLPKGSLPAVSVDCFKQPSPMPPWAPPAFNNSTSCSPQGKC